MSKHLDDLKRIHKKLGSRFGQNDDIVQQLQKVIELHEQEVLEKENDAKLERRKNQLHPSNRGRVAGNADPMRQK